MFLSSADFSAKRKKKQGSQFIPDLGSKFCEAWSGSEVYSNGYPQMTIEVIKRTKIRNRYNQVPHLTQDTIGKVTNTQFDITNESQEVSPFPAGDHKVTIKRRAQKHNKHMTEIYSVQIRDVGRFLAKFNPWTNTFGNRLFRLHWSRIHPSVKLSTPKVYTCSLIVVVSWKISVSNYWRWIWSAQIPCLKYVHTSILNTCVYLKIYNQNINLRQCNLQSHTFYCFIRDMCTLSLWSIYWALSMPNFNVYVSVCVGGWGGQGGYFNVVVLMLFFRIQS